MTASLLRLTRATRLPLMLRIRPKGAPLRGARITP